MHRLPVLLSLLVAAHAAGAAEIYRWTDDDGVVHYSQWAPVAAVSDAETVELPTQTPGDYDPDADPYSVLNQAARTHETWKAVASASERPRVERTATQHDEADADAYRDDLYFVALPPPRIPRDPLSAQRRQIPVIEEIERRAVPRAHSINASGHRARVAASRDALDTVLRRPPEAPKR